MLCCCATQRLLSLSTYRCAHFFETLAPIITMTFFDLQWLTSIPGIDEATALASVMKLVESGTFTSIVFDTAPTGHTLKLLGLPKMLQAGLDRINVSREKGEDHSVSRAGSHLVALSLGRARYGSCTR